MDGTVGQSWDLWPFIKDFQKITLHDCILKTHLFMEISHLIRRIVEPHHEKYKKWVRDHTSTQKRLHDEKTKIDKTINSLMHKFVENRGTSKNKLKRKEKGKKERKKGGGGERKREWKKSNYKLR